MANIRQSESLSTKNLSRVFNNTIASASYMGFKLSFNCITKKGITYFRLECGC